MLNASSISPWGDLCLAYNYPTNFTGINTDSFKSMHIPNEWNITTNSQ